MTELPDPGSTRALPRWAHPEFGWPLALAAGFVGTWLGLQTQVPGMGALLATVLFAPLHMVVLARSRGGVATLFAVGWSVGIVAAVVGTTLDSGWGGVVEGLPGADEFTRVELRSWIAGPGPTAGESRLALFHSALALVAMLALSRPLAGIPALLITALGLGLIGAGAAWVVQEAELLGQSSLTASLLGIGPHRYLQGVGFFFVWAALAEPTPCWPPSYMDERRRQRLWGGLAAILAGLAAQGFAIAPWTGAVDRWLG